MGAWTNLGCGGVLDSNMPGLQIGGGPVTTWRINNIVATGGGANTDLTSTCTSHTAAATARTPTPSLGTGATLSLNLAATSYAMDVQAIGPGGTSNTATITYTVVALAFNRGDNIAGADQAARFTNVAAGMGGKTMLLSVGADYGTTVLSFNNIRPASVYTVNNADNARPARLIGFDIVDSLNVTVDGLVFPGSATPTNYTIMSIRRNSQVTDTITVRNCSMSGTSRATAPSSNQQNSISIFVSGDVTNVLVEDNVFSWVGRGISISGTTTNVIVQRNTFRYFFADGIAFGTVSGTSVLNNTFVSPMRYGGIVSPTSPDHADAYQFNNSAVISGLTLSGNVWIQADGNLGLTAGQAGQTSNTGMTMSRNLFVLRTVGIELGNQTSATVEDNTIFMTGSGVISQADYNCNDNIYTNVMRFRAAGTNTTSTSARNWAANFDIAAGMTNPASNVVAAASYPAITNTQYPVYSTTGTPTPIDYTPNITNTFDFSPYLNYTDARERLDNYDASTNPNGTDYANMTVAQIVARVVLILTPKTGGSLDLGAGVSAGAITLAGALKT
jgi:hypothetical protein